MNAKTQLIDRCMTSAYPTVAVLKRIGNTDLKKTEYTEVYISLTETKGQGQGGMVGQLYELGVVSDDCYYTHIIDSF